MHEEKAPNPELASSQARTFISKIQRTGKALECFSRCTTLCELKAILFHSTLSGLKADKILICSYLEAFCSTLKPKLVALIYAYLNNLLNSLTEL